MDDFLGTSIQYSEQQIKLLEKEYAHNQKKIVEELINSGYLDSDYDDSTSTEGDFSDNENEIDMEGLEVKENSTIYTNTPSIESLDDVNMNISPKSLEDTLDSPTSPSDFVNDLSMTSTEDDSDRNNYNNLALALVSDISAVDEILASNSDIINDADPDSDEYDEYEDMDDVKEQECHEQILQEINQFEVITSKAIIRFMEFVFSDIKYLMVLFVLMMAMPHIMIHPHHDHDTLNVYGGIKYETNNHNNAEYTECGGQRRRQFLHETSIYMTMEPLSTRSRPSYLNEEEEEEERDEYDEDAENEEGNQCQNKPRQHVLNFDIMTTTTDTITNKVYRRKLYHHELKIKPSDLFSCDDVEHQQVASETNIPRLFLQFGAAGGGLKSSPQMMRIFKETMSETVGRQFRRNHGLYALVMSFVVIAAFAASNNEFITISS